MYMTTIPGKYVPGKLCFKPTRKSHKEFCPSKKEKKSYDEGLKSYFSTNYIDYKNSSLK